MPGHVIVIECKPTHPYSWKLRFEQQLAHRSLYGLELKSYKPKKWEDVEKAMEEHPDYDVMSSNFNFLWKLVVDPLLDFPDSYGMPHPCEKYSYDMNSPYGRYPVTQPGLVEAVKYMMTLDPWDGSPKVVVYRQWLQSKRISSLSSSPLGEEHCRTHGHDLLSSSPVVEGIQQTIVDCVVCEKQVMRSDNMGNGYCYCKNCSFTLHMECALSCNEDDYAGRRRGVIQSGKPFVKWRKPCKEAGKGIYNQCMKWEFEYHLRTPVRSPIAIKHFDTTGHFLTKILLEMEKYRCFACGGYGKGDMYLCKDCGFSYHYKCLTMPRRVKNVHGGHHHHLSLKFESEEAEDYMCQECQELRDPVLWYYSCEDCVGYELHPSCVTKFRPRNFITEWMDEAEINAINMSYNVRIEMQESESISDFYSRVIYPIQWYGELRNEAQFIDEILGALPLKFYHIVVAIKRSEEYESMSMTVDQLMISLRVYEKKIDNGEDVIIELVLANLYATQRSSSIDNKYYYWLITNEEDEKLIMNAKDVSLKSVLDTDYSKQESGDNWIKYWGRYWDNYWFNYQRGFYSSKDKSKVQCSICYMFGHDPRHCWSTGPDIVTVGPRIVQSQSNRSSPEMELDLELRL